MRPGVRRVVGYTVVAIAVYVLVLAVGVAVTPGASADAFALPGVLAGAVVGYYLVYLGGYRRLAERFG